jgi:hypothetical protein
MTQTEISAVIAFVVALLPAIAALIAAFKANDSARTAIAHANRAQAISLGIKAVDDK